MLVRKKDPKIQVIDEVVNMDMIRTLNVSGIPYSISSIFAPHLSRVVNYSNKSVISCELEKFKRRLKITPDDTILSVMDIFYRHGFSPILAGGKLISYLNGDSCADSSISDYDLFMVGEHDCDNILRQVTSMEGFYGMEVLAVLPNVIELMYSHSDVTIKIQIVRKVYACIEDIIQNFDIRGCAVAYFKGRVYWVNKALKDIKTKTIVALSPRKDFKVFNRISRYCNKGWSLNIPDALAFSVCAIDGIMDGLDIYKFRSQQIDAMVDRDSMHARTVDYEGDGHEVYEVEMPLFNGYNQPLLRADALETLTIPITI